MVGLVTIDIPLRLPYRRVWFETYWRTLATTSVVSVYLSTAGVYDTTNGNYDQQIERNLTGTPSAVDSPGTAPWGGTISASTSTASFYSCGTLELVSAFDPVYTTLQSMDYDAYAPYTFVSRSLWKNTGIVDGIRFNLPTAANCDTNSYIRMFGER
jgi:hypothetical protein